MDDTVTTQNYYRIQNTEPDDLRPGVAATHVYACLAMVIVDWKVATAASVDLVGLFYLYSRSLLLIYLRTQLLGIAAQVC